jgi:hypothetical protein
MGKREKKDRTERMRTLQGRDPLITKTRNGLTLPHRLARSVKNDMTRVETVRSFFKIALKIIVFSRRKIQRSIIIIISNCISSDSSTASNCITGNHKRLRCYVCFTFWRHTEKLFEHYDKEHRIKTAKKETLLCPYCGQSLPFKSVSCHIITSHIATREAKRDATEKNGKGGPQKNGSTKDSKKDKNGSSSGSSKTNASKRTRESEGSEEEETGDDDDDDEGDSDSGKKKGKQSTGGSNKKAKQSNKKKDEESEDDDED